MKLLSLVAGLLTAELASAEVADAYIPFDCYQHSQKTYGVDRGVIESDKNVLSGLDINDSRLVQISYCKDVRTDVYTGLTTTWAKWVDGERTDLKRLEIIGSVAPLYDFDRNGALRDAGLEELTADQLWGFDPYWYQEASPYQEKFYTERAAVHENAVEYDMWRYAMQNYFVAADTNGDGELTYEEAKYFLENVRQYD